MGILAESKKEIGLEDINTELLARLNPAERHYNMKFLDEEWSKVSDRAVDAWRRGDMELAMDFSEESRRIMNTIDYYEKHRYLAIEKAREYENTRRIVACPNRLFG